DRDALVWGHCHHRATGGMSPEHQLLSRMGVSVQPLQGGCCGLAGSWGFENGKYDISLQCGEQALLPAVRSAELDTVIVADGFSCKTQIEQAGTGRGALHVAQVMKMAREHGADGHRGTLPEQPYNHVRPGPGRGRRARRLAALGVPLAVLAAAATVWARSGRKVL
ncbi:MAG: FAD-binding oxidoreductase, partial [Pseudonocardiaceae bacterium]